MGSPVFRSCPRPSARLNAKNNAAEVKATQTVRLANWRSSKHFGENSKMSDGRTSAYRRRNGSCAGEAKINALFQDGGRIIKTPFGWMVGPALTESQ